MNIYRIVNGNDVDYDMYDSAIVAAESPEEARTIHPSGREYSYDTYSWCPLDKVSVELIGVAAHTIQKGVILASFNAG